MNDCANEVQVSYKRYLLNHHCLSCSLSNLLCWFCERNECAIGIKRLFLGQFVEDLACHHCKSSWVYILATTTTIKIALSLTCLENEVPTKHIRFLTYNKMKRSRTHAERKSGEKQCVKW